MRRGGCSPLLGERSPHGAGVAAAVAAGAVGADRDPRCPPGPAAALSPAVSPRLCATCRLPQASAWLFLPTQPPAGSAVWTGVSISSLPDPRSGCILLGWPGIREFRPLWPCLAQQRVSLCCLDVGKPLSICGVGLEKVIGFVRCLRALSCNEIWEQRNDECGEKKGYQLAQGRLMLFRGRIR